MDIYQPERPRRGRARERYAARQQRKMAVPVVSVAEKPVTTRAPQPPARLPVLIGRIQITLRDFFWHLRTNRVLSFAAMGIVAALILLWLGSYVLPGRIFPNVWALGANLGDLTVDEAVALLQDRWANDITISLYDEDRLWTATPYQLGLTLDARATAEAARAVGLGGIMLGYTVLPTVAVDELASQNYFLDLTERSKILPYNAGYRWEGERLVGVAGADGRFLDIAQTMHSLQENVAYIVDQRRLDLIMTPMPPDVRDPNPYLEQARAFASQQFIMRGYDPFLDESVAWTTDRDTLTSWLEAGEDGLSLREDIFASFVDAQTQMLRQADDLRYLEPVETIEKMRDAINTGVNEVYLRIRYRSAYYTVQAGDTGYRIAARNGIPFYQLQVANPGRDWDQNLSVGEQVTLPSRDITVPLDPIPNKRIVVNIDTQYMVAYENGEIVFNWDISSGMERAPTSPGIYQILNHDPVASGGSYELCGAYGCSQWQMYWFMGIYEVYPGLVNGFHGGVLLPNGAYLGGNQVGRPYTYGCIMALNEEAELLYNWADDGTIVEIIDSSFEPQSQLAKQMLEEGWGV
ncbi:MAG: L,D-transpeptidase family protein [Anaerolinea sp.]|nr:L,D-transpeptidase family protein [Anaerolinea sp.]